MENSLNNNFDLNNQGVSNAAHTVDLGRHRWYYYKEGFSPQIVQKAIVENELNKNSVVIDPFNGSGTVTLTSTAMGIPSHGIEVNPFTAFIAKSKLINTSSRQFEENVSRVLDKINARKKSRLEGFSTFSEKEGINKWLFNKSVIRSFSAGLSESNKLESKEDGNLIKLALIYAAMQNCNAKKDGKCLRYKPNWHSLSFDKQSFIKSFQNKVAEIIEDTKDEIEGELANIYNEDARKELKNVDSFDLCITSPPYANTFDYTDIYRPELFLSEFISSNEDLYNLRLRTIRSHVQAKWEAPKNNLSSALLNELRRKIDSKKEFLMHRHIPIMLSAYFEDMDTIFKTLYTQANHGAEVWMVVANSAYANVNVQVDLILSEIATNIGWKLKEIGVLREIRKRKTKYSPDIDYLRESVIILRKD